MYIVSQLYKNSIILLLKRKEKKVMQQEMEIIIKLLLSKGVNVDIVSTWYACISTTLGMILNVLHYYVIDD